MVRKEYLNVLSKCMYLGVSLVVVVPGVPAQGGTVATGQGWGCCMDVQWVHNAGAVIQGGQHPACECPHLVCAGAHTKARPLQGWRAAAGTRCSKQPAKCAIIVLKGRLCKVWGLTGQNPADHFHAQHTQACGTALGRVGQRQQS